MNTKIKKKKFSIGPIKPGAAIVARKSRHARAARRGPPGFFTQLRKACIKLFLLYYFLAERVLEFYRKHIPKIAQFLAVFGATIQGHTNVLRSLRQFFLYESRHAAESFLTLTRIDRTVRSKPHPFLRVHRQRKPRGHGYIGKKASVSTPAHTPRRLAR